MTSFTQCGLLQFQGILLCDNCSKTALHLGAIETECAQSFASIAVGIGIVVIPLVIPNPICEGGASASQWAAVSLS